MRRPEKPALLRWLYRSEFEGIVAFRDMLRRGARAALGKDAIAAEAYVETNLNSVWNYLLQAQDADEKRGISRIFDVFDPTARTLQWCSPLCDARRAARLKDRAAILSMIDALTNREFEALACVALRLVGATETFLTPPGNEGGVDFFALVPSPTRCHLFSSGSHPLRIIGQSKKYSNPVEASVFKEFLQTINEVKSGGEPKTEKIIPTWFHVRGPIIAVMVAHSGFQSGATTRARRHGVIIADSIDMAEILALSRGIPEHLPSLDRVLKCKDSIQAILS
jgi:hypothetical protein